MIDVHAALATRFPAARMILTVHDELLFEAPAGAGGGGRGAGPAKDGDAVPLNVPLDVDVGIGETGRREA